ncbi:MAG: LURP-one-related family protein [Micrococcus sp.]|nr:LURP-one-related family protein [Micrococcus sp.]
MTQSPVPRPSDHVDQEPLVLVFQQVTAMMSNDFTIQDVSGQPVAQVHTRGSGLARLFMGSRDLEVTDLQGNTLFMVQDIVTMGRDRYQVLNAHGEVIANLVHRITFFTTQMEVQVIDGTVMELRGNLFDYDFQILVGQTPVAEVSRQWSGLGRALMGHSTYLLRLDPQMPDMVRYATMGAVISLDLLRAKEDRRRRQN